jgi:hypothetical protein
MTIDRRDLAEQGYVKLEMRDSDGFVETAWAQRTDPDRDEFRLDNNPFYAYRVSAGDVVEGELIVPGLYRFVRVVHPSGNRSVRVAFETFKADAPEAEPILTGLKSLGCDYEGMFGRVIAVNIPPHVKLAEVADFLTGTGIRWEYANPTYSDLFGD